MSQHAHTILAIDDDIDDLTILQDAIDAVDVTSTLVTAQNGAVGLEKLEQMKRDGRLPCLIVLDINMPVMDGRKTYDAIKSDKALQDIPIVVFSTSSSPLDKTFFQLRGAEYIIKPVQFEQLLQVARKFLDYCSA